MDIATGLGLIAGAIVLVALILMGGNLGMFLDSHAFIVIFGGATGTSTLVVAGRAPSGTRHPTAEAGTQPESEAWALNRERADG